MKIFSPTVNAGCVFSLIVSISGCSTVAPRSAATEALSVDRAPANANEKSKETIVVLADPRESETRALVLFTETFPSYRFTAATCLLRSMAVNKGHSMRELMDSSACHAEVVFTDAREVQAFVEKVADYSDKNRDAAAAKIWSSHAYFVASSVLAGATALGSLWLLANTPLGADFSHIRGPLAGAIDRITLNFQFMEDFKLFGPSASHWSYRNLAEGVPAFRIGTEEYAAVFVRSSWDVAKAKGAIKTLKIANRLVIPAAIAGVAYGFITASSVKASEEKAHDSAILVGTAKDLLRSNNVENPKDISFKAMARIFRDTGYAPKFGTTPLKSID